MNELLLMAYEGLTVILPLLITFAILSSIYKRKEIPQTKMRFFMLFVFAIYMLAVFYLTGVGTIFDLHRNGIEIDHGFNALPFSRDIDVTAYFLNVLLFVPFSFLVPFIWPNRAKYTVLSGFLFSLLIETSQLFNSRQTDIDDLLMNTLGALIGYLMYCIFAKIIKRTTTPVNHLKYEPAVYILAMFFGHFLMFDVMGAAKILYGF